MNTGKILSKQISIALDRSSKKTEREINRSKWLIPMKYRIKVSLRKLKNKFFHRKHKKGVMLLDSKIIEHLIESIKGKDVKGKYIYLKKGDDK